MNEYLIITLVVIGAFGPGVLVGWLLGHWHRAEGEDPIWVDHRPTGECPVCGWFHE